MSARQPITTSWDYEEVDIWDTFLQMGGFWYFAGFIITIRKEHEEVDRMFVNNVVPLIADKNFYALPSNAGKMAHCVINDPRVTEFETVAEWQQHLPHHLHWG